MKPVQWKVGTSSALFGGLTVKNLQQIKEAGLDCLEICLFGAISGYEELARQGTDLGLDFWSIHLPFGQSIDISVIDEKLRKDTVERLKGDMESAACFRPRKAIVHGSSEPIAAEEREARLSACRESLSELAGYANSLSMQLAVECLPRTCLGNCITEMRRIIDGIGNLAVCCDTNHLLIDKTEDFISAVGSRVVSLHVSDYDRIDERHWIPERGVNDWSAIIRNLEAADYQGPFMFEVVNRGTAAPVSPRQLRECWDGLLAKLQ